MNIPQPNSLGEQYDLLIRHRQELEISVDLGRDIGRRRFTVTPIGNTGNLLRINFRGMIYTPVKCNSMTDVQGYCHVLYERWVQSYQ